MARFRWGLVLGFCFGFWAVRRWLWLPPERRGHRNLRLDLADQVPPRPPAPAPQEEEVVAFCMRCRAMRPMAHAERTTTQRGQPAYRGVCSVCGAKMFRMLPRST